MYYYNLKINIFSNDASLETEMKKTPPMERLGYEIHTYHAVSAIELKNCNIVILDLPITGNLEKIRLQCTDDVILVFCAEAAQIMKCSEADYQLFGAIWTRPFSPFYVNYQFKKLLELIELKKDCQFSQECLDTLINSIPDLVWFKDIRGSHIKVNDAFCHAVGKTKQDVEGRGHYYIWDLKQEEYEKGEYVCLETEEMVLQERKTCLFDEKVKSKNGLRQFKTYKSPLFDDCGETIGTVGVAHDVTDLENIGTELKIFLSSMPFAILVKNSEGRIINANEKFDTYFKLKRDEMIGKDYEVWKKEALRSMSGVNAEGYAEATICIEGDRRLLEIHEEPIYDVFSNLAGQICICRDVTRERALEHQILRNSNTDFMTGLFNRRYFYEYMNKNYREGTISLIYVDLDYFKKVNDTYGHQSGDEALIAVASLLKRCFPDTFIARLGGDEFLIALLGTYSMAFLENKASELLCEMQKTFHASNQWNILSASIGIAQSADPEVRLDTLIKRSDMALYEAKRRGRAQYCVYTPDLKENPGK